MPVKVGFLAPALPMGGAERWLLSLARHFDPKRVQLIGTALCEWSVEHPDMCRELARYMPIYGTVLPANADLTRHETKGIVRRPGPDASTGIGIICSQADTVLTWTDSHIRTMTGYYVDNYDLKTVLVSHNECKHWCANMQHEATHLAAVSEAAFGGFKEPVPHMPTVIYNGADVERCAPVLGRKAFRERYHIEPWRIVITYVGRFSPEKHCYAAAAAAAHLGGPYYALYAIGDTSYGGQPKEYMDSISNLSAGKCKFLTSLNSIGDVLAATDVMVSCADFEGFSLATTEAWLAGVPVVSTPTGAIPELERRFGPLTVKVGFRPGPPEIGAAVIQALSRENQVVVDRARRVAWEHFTATAMAERWMQYLETL